MNCILIRLGELFLKGKNRDFFEKLLRHNIKHVLDGFSYEFHISPNRYYVENYDTVHENDIIDALLSVPGVYSVSIATKVKSDFGEINVAALKLSKGSKSFRISVTRADKRIAGTSMKIAADIGEYILNNNHDIKVDLFNYETEIFVDIRENGFTYVFSKQIRGLGGLPVGSSGTGLLLLSGGIDSPVAGFSMTKRGVKICAIHFASPPYTSESAKEKVIELSKKLVCFNGGLKLFVVPFTEIQMEIYKKCKREYTVTLMRRFMMRISERIALDVGCNMLITGESLGQVASQTAESLAVVENVLERLPVLRPLIAMDKEEIVTMANKIDTYKTSILPHQDCCTVFVPKNPIIRPKLEKIVDEEKKLEMHMLIAAAVSGIETIDVL